MDYGLGFWLSLRAMLVIVERRHFGERRWTFGGKDWQQGQVVTLGRVRREDKGGWWAVRSAAK